MPAFWRINLIVSLSVFILFLLDAVQILITESSTVVFFLSAITSWFFIYGTFLELIQIPICILALFIWPRPKMVLFYFLLMFILFITKFAIYFLVFGSAAERN